MQRLQNLHNSELQVQIALDIDLIGLFGTEQAELEYQYWWGPKFNEDLSSIPYGVTKHNNEHYDNVFTNLCFQNLAGTYKMKDKPLNAKK